VEITQTPRKGARWLSLAWKLMMGTELLAAVYIGFAR
jgi:hypothetical protein